MTHPVPVTKLVERSRGGDASATSQLMPLIYDQLHALASHYMANERAGHTLQATALVHEAYVRLTNGAQSSWQNRAHFFAAAANTVRRILVEHARSRRSQWKRELSSDAVDITQLPAKRDDDRIIAVDRAIERLAAERPSHAHLIELRYFGGLKVDDVAEAMRASPRTIARDWAIARAWLARELRQEDGLDG